MIASSADRPGKWGLRFGLVLVVGLGGLIALTLVGRGLSRVTQSEKTSDVLIVASELPPELEDALTWLPDAPDLPRPMEPLTRNDVAAAWLRAWAQLAVVETTGDTGGLEVYFSNSALEGVLASHSEPGTNQTRQIGHELKLTFYSEDGQVVGLTSTNSRVLRGRQITGSDGAVRTAYFDGSEQYEAVLLLEDGNWRVQHWVRTGTDGQWWNEPLTEEPPTLESVAPQAFVDGGGDHPLGAMGEITFDATLSAVEVDALVEEVAAEGAVVRMRIGRPTGLADSVTDSSSDGLRRWLDRFNQRGVLVVATLFDGHVDHSPEVWDADDRYLAELLPHLRDHPAVMLYDLRLGADRDVSEVADRDMVDAWLSHVGRTVRSHDPDTPVTIGWSSPDEALAAPGIEDIITFVAHDPDTDLELIRASTDAHQIFVVPDFSE